MQPDITPCRGIRADDTVQPLAFCRNCARWITAHKAPADAIFMPISYSDLAVVSGRLYCLYCLERKEA